MSVWRRIIACVLSYALVVSGCGCSAPSPSNGNDSSSKPQTNEASQNSVAHSPSEDGEPTFTGLDDEALHQYVQDDVYAQLEEELGDDYKVESVQAVYVSKEYLQELSYNSQENIYFGYSLSDLENHFEGSKYVFTLGDDGQTVVTEFQGTNDGTFAEVTKNVAIGGGVILVCVTVSAATGGVAPVVSTVFAASATNAATFAASSAVIGAATGAIVTGIETGNPEEALRQAALKGSEGFKCGAIGGAIAGGLAKAGSLYYENSLTDIPTPRQAEIEAESKYSGRAQVSFFKGSETSSSTLGASRPDIIRNVDGHPEAIEVKCYDLSSPQSFNELKHVLRNQVSQRMENLPPGSTQRIVLNVRGRGYSQKFIKDVVNKLRATLDPIYPGIPIDVMV